MRVKKDNRTDLNDRLEGIYELSQHRWKANFLATHRVAIRNSFFTDRSQWSDCVVVPLAAVMLR